MENRKEQEQGRFQIEKLEERIAPVVHAFTPVGDAGHPTEGHAHAGGIDAAPHLLGTGQITGFPVPENTPGVGPS